MKKMIIAFLAVTLVFSLIGCDAMLNVDGSIEGEPTEAALVAFAKENGLKKWRMIRKKDLNWSVKEKLPGRILVLTADADGAGDGEKS